MEDTTKTAIQIDIEVGRIHNEIQPALYETNPTSEELYALTVEEWYEKILTITLKINSQYPELSKYLEEMTVTIPDEKNPEIALGNLKDYYNSLNSIASKYKLELSVKEQQKKMA